MPETTGGARNEERSGTYTLHRQLLDFAEYVSLQDVERRARRGILQRLCVVTTSLWHGSTASLCGSAANQLDWIGSDVDVAVCGGAMGDARRCCYELEEELRHCRWARKIETRPSASVPIVTFLDGKTGVHVDVGFEEPRATSSSAVIELVQGVRPADFNASKALILVLKVYLRQKGLDKPFHGGLGSFKLGALIAYYTTHLFQTPADFGEVLVGFMRFCIEVDFRTFRVLLLTGDQVSFHAGFQAHQLKEAFRVGLEVCSGEPFGAGTEVSRLIAAEPLRLERCKSLQHAEEEMRSV